MKNTGLMNTALLKDAAIWVAIVGAVAAVLTLGITAIFAHQGGIYGGMTYDDARMKAERAMAVRYGLGVAERMQLGHPDVVKTHLHSLALGTGQVRVFHLIGPKGVRYCVGVNQDATAITKGCKW